MDATPTTTISAQVFCDNYCDVYYNGEAVFIDPSASRTVETFSFTSDRTGVRTFAVRLRDNPISNESHGIRNYLSATFLAGQTDSSGDPITQQYCLGHGAFRAIFTDDKCGEVVVTNASWSCMRVRSGPDSIHDCFPTWESKYIYPTFGGEDDRYLLYAPCIRNTELAAACSSTVYWYDSAWNTVGFDDNCDDWFAATEYSVFEGVPKGGRGGTAFLFECEDHGYCNICDYPESSWGDSSFIWSDEVVFDNEILCRYEYTVSSC